MTAVLPSSKTTLVILLGASSWPFSPEFQASEAFLNSALEVRDYFLNPSQFGLPSENLLNLFDSNLSADDIDGEIGHYLGRRMLEMKQAGRAARDLVVYFIGHGGFVGNDSDYYLAIHRTRTDNPSVSGIRMVSLAYTLKEKARYLRRIVILDCCFAGAAFRAFQSGPDQTAIIQAVDAFKVQGKGIGVPERGTSLLCSSGHKAPSLISQDGTHTIFSQALLQALSTGNPRQQNGLSLRDIANLTEDALHTMPEKGTPRPEVHSPDQVDGNVAEVPLFPNLAMRTTRASQNVTASSVTQKPPQANPLPSLVLPAPAVSPLSPQPMHTTSHQGLSRGKRVLLIVMALLVIAGGVGLYSVVRTNQFATEYAATATVVAANTAIVAATATVVAATPNPYSPNYGTLVLYNPYSQPLQSQDGHPYYEGCRFHNGAVHVTRENCSSDFTFPHEFAFEVHMTIITGDCGIFSYVMTDTTISKDSLFLGFGFRVCQDGTYDYYIFLPSDHSLLQKGSTASPTISRGLGQNNLIAVVSMSHTLTMYVNHQQLDSIVNNSFYTTEGWMSFGPSASTDTAFHDEKVWAL